MTVSVGSLPALFISDITQILETNKITGVKTIFSASRNLILGIGLYLVSTVQAGTTVNYEYTVQVNDNLTGLTVKACFTDPLPSKLISYDTSTTQYLETAALISNGQIRTILRPGNHAIALPAIKPGDCVSYEINFKGKTTHAWFKHRQSKDQQILVDIHRWLWLPDTFDADRHTLEITFQLPDGMVVSSPWRLVNEGNNSVTYHYAHRPPGWEGRIAIGHFKTVTRTIGSAKIRVAILNGRQRVDSDKIMRWVDKNLDALSKTYGKFPVSELQLLVVPVGKDREPVPWGQTMRGGGDAIHVYIDQTQPLNEFLEDWVLIHELSHLLHPRLYDASWLSEGLASYYQNVLGARGGLLSKQRAWQKLHEGFQRGIRETPPDKTLKQISESMMQTRSFMRVYWSGAAISLLADYKLRRQSNNKQSLDTALARLNQCCLPARRLWTGIELMEKLDSLTNTNIFTDLYYKHLPSTHFPDLSHVYKELGLTVKDNKIILNKHAPYLSIRKSIVSPTK